MMKIILIMATKIMKMMTVKKLVWKNKAGGNRLIAVKTTNDDMNEFVEAYPVMPTHGAPWLTPENQKIFLNRAIINEDGSKTTFNEMIEESLRQRFLQQSKNPEWIEQFLEKADVTADKNARKVDPRLDGVYYPGMDAEPLEFSKEKKPQKPQVTKDDLQELNNDQLIEMAVKLGVIGWSSRDNKEKLMEKISKHIGLDEEPQEPDEPED